MPKPPTPLTTSLRRLLHRHVTSSPPPPSLSSFHHLTFPLSKNLFSTSQPHLQNDPIALSLSSELLKQPQVDPTTTTTTTSLSLLQRLDLSFSHVTLTPPLILHTLNNSPGAGRASLELLKWVGSKSPQFELSDEVLSYFVDYFGRRKDFRFVFDEVMGVYKDVAGEKTFEVLVDRLVRAGRPKEAVSLFDRMEMEYGIVRDRRKYDFVVSKLCDHGFANVAEKFVKDVANEFFPDEKVCDLLIRGWCVDGKLEEAKRLAREMYRGGFEIGTAGYNAILDCVCRLCRVKDPFRMQGEAENVLVDMDAAGVPRNTETFNVLIENLCKVRMTEEGLKLFDRMGEWGCYPDSKTFVVLIKSLYQAARVGGGDEMIDRMKSAGFGDALDKKVYYEFLKILCGIERVEHALSVFRRMKKDGCTPGVKSYELLIGKLYAHGRAEKAKTLFNEAVRNGVDIERKEWKVDPRFEKKPKVVRKGKKRLTLPEKMVLKRKKLRKIRLSFVKKPRKMMRQAF